MALFTPVPVRTNSGVVNLDYLDFSGAGSLAAPVHLAPTHVLLDASGNPISSANPFPVALPAVSASAPLPTCNGYASPVASTWTSSTSANAALTVSTAGMDGVIVTLAPSGTLTAGVLSFEIYDGVNWLPIKGARPESYLTDQTYALASGASRAWQFSVAGFLQFRVRLSIAIAGGGSCLVTAIASSAPCMPEMTVGLDPNAPLPAGSNVIGTVNSVAANPSMIVAGQQTAGLSAVALPAQAIVNGVVLKAPASNAAAIYVGPSGVTSSTGFPLNPGESISYAVTNLSAIFLIGSNATDLLAYTGN